MEAPRTDRQKLKKAECGDIYVPGGDYTQAEIEWDRRSTGLQTVRHQNSKHRAMFVL